MSDGVVVDLHLKQALKLAPLAGVLLFCLIYALAFASIYGEEHAYQKSSRWIYNNLPRGAKIVGVHWDDSLPLTLPDHPASTFRSLGELPLYEADSPTKVALIAEKLSKTDYLILPTQRLQGSVPRLPLEFPYTTNLFRLLYRDELGFKLIKTIKERPSLPGVVFNDDLADESFSVYDHPKVSIFKNEGRLSAAEIRKEITSPAQTGYPSLEMMLSRDAPNDQLPAGNR